MSLDATIARAVSLNSLDMIRRYRRSSPHGNKPDQGQAQAQTQQTRERHNSDLITRDNRQAHIIRCERVHNSVKKKDPEVKNIAQPKLQSHTRTTKDPSDQKHRQVSKEHKEHMGQKTQNMQVLENGNQRHTRESRARQKPREHGQQHKECKYAEHPPRLRVTPSTVNQLYQPLRRIQPSRRHSGRSQSNPRSRMLGRYPQSPHSTALQFHENLEHGQCSVKVSRKYRYVPLPAPKAPMSSHPGYKSSEKTTTSESSTSQTSACNSLAKQIISTVGELESTVFENSQLEFNLRMALSRQAERIHDLRSSLNNEKERNQRLLHLVRGVESSSTSADETSDYVLRGYNTGQHAQPWQSRTSMDAFESISPLLLQQRFDELTASYKQCRRQLARKERSLATSKYEKEALQSKYDNLFDEYRNVQKRFEELCYKYLRLQARKNLEIRKLRDVITYASDCVLTAQHIQDTKDNQEALHYYHKQFQQNLGLFIQALRMCEGKACERHANVHQSVAK